MINNQKPEIRFPGFTGEWEQRKLDSIVDRVKSYSLSRDVETSEYTGYKYIHYGDIHTKVADVIDESSNLPNIKAGNYELLEKGDLVIADASEDYLGIATPAVITIDIPYKLVSGLHTIALRPKQVDSLFLYYLINSPTFRRYGYKTGTGMKVFGISVTNLLKFEGMLPLLEEQTKISFLLKRIDETIALHQQELTTLKQTKQGFLQKMFPKEGESVPEIRFPGFSEDWKQCKLSDIKDIRDGTHDSPKYYKEGFPLVTSKNLKENGLDMSDVSLISEVDYHSINKRSKVDIGDIIFGMIGTIGNPVLVNIEGFAIKNVALIKHGGKVTNEFLIQLLKSPTFKRFIQNENVGNTQKFLGLSKIRDYRFLSPSYQEQIKIGHFFKQLDDLVVLHQYELDALKETKKAFLQKMFV